MDFWSFVFWEKSSFFLDLTIVSESKTHYGNKLSTILHFVRCSYCQLFMFQLDFSKEPSYLFIFLSLSFLSPIPDNGDILNIVTFQFLHIYIFLTSQTFHQETEEADKWLHLENYEPQWNTILRTVNTFLRVTLFFPFSSLTFPSASTFLSGFLGMPFLHKIFLHGV